MTRQITLLERSVVVVGQHHNPSILNPDFLWRHHIVPVEIKLADDPPPISTPMVSQCNFENGTYIISNPDQITFADKILEADNKSSVSCYEVAEKYLNTVPHVRYVAVGINFTGFFSDFDNQSTPCNMLIEQVQREFDGASPAAEVILTYTLADLTVNLTIKHIPIPGSENGKKIIFHGNCHHAINIDQDNSHKVAIAIVDDWEKDLMRFEHLATSIIQSIGDK